MLNRSRTVGIILFVLWLVLPGASFGEEELLLPRGRWERLPLILTDRERISDFRLDEDGIPWIIAGQGLKYWDGEEFQVFNEPNLIPHRVTNLIGGGNAGLHVVVRRNKFQDRHEGKLLRLRRGTAIPVTDLIIDERSSQVRVHVSSSGTVVNWGKRFISVLGPTGWKRTEVYLDHYQTLIFDSAHATHFLSDTTLFSVDQAGEVRETTLEEVFPVGPGRGRTRLEAAAWREGEMILARSNGPGFHAIKLDTGESVEVDWQGECLEGISIQKLVGCRDGSVLAIVKTSERSSIAFRFLHIDPEGVIRALSETEFGNWFSWSILSRQESVLAARDGTLWICCPNAGVASIRDKEVRVYDWKNGLFVSGCRILQESPDGKIFAASEKELFLFHPDQDPAPPPAWTGNWQQIRANFSPLPVYDGEGRVWLCHQDRPGEVSVHDGQSWKHIAVPFDTPSAIWLIPDDRGHILVRRNAKEAGEPTSFEITDQGVLQHESFEKMIEAAVRDGARRFYSRPAGHTIVVVEDRIWWQSSGGPKYFDGLRWDAVASPGMGRSATLLESSRYGMLVRTSRNSMYTFHTWVRGRFEEILVPEKTKTAWLFGPRGLQPYDSDLAAREPDRYFTAIVTAGEKLRFHLPVEQGKSRTLDLAHLNLGDEVSLGGNLKPAFSGGYFSAKRYGQVKRIFNGWIVNCDLRATPLQGRGDSVCGVLEDREGNLWFDMGLYQGARQIFFRRGGSVSVEVGVDRIQEGRSVDIPIRIQQPSWIPSEPIVFWRSGGSPWQRSPSAGKVTCRFRRSGDHEIELAALDARGALTKLRVPILVSADVSLPDTRLLVDGVVKLTDMAIEAPASLIPSGEGKKPKLLWRIRSGPWIPADPDGRMILGDLEPGLHHIVMAAEEEEFYRDPTPVTVMIQYEPDWEGIVSRRFEIILNGSPEEAQQAFTDLSFAGSPALSLLRNRLDEARRQACLIESLEEIIKKLEKSQDP